jgi:hypothetical protein
LLKSEAWRVSQLAVAGWLSDDSEELEIQYSVENAEQNPDGELVGSNLR